MTAPTRKRLLLAVTVFATLVFVPASSAMRPGLSVGFLPRGIHAFFGPGGSISINACPAPTKRGEATCFADLRIDSHARSERPAGAGGAVTADALGDNGGYSPAFLQSAYNAPSASGGIGKTVAVVGAFDDPGAESDLAAYRSHYGLPACTTANGCFRKVNQSGAASPLPQLDPGGGWALEASLDLDMVSAVCPNCHLLLVEASGNFNTGLLPAVGSAVALGANVISMSWGAPFQDFLGTFDEYPGVRFFAASGDSGYQGFANYPAASSYVTAVGGTSLDQATSNGTRDATETAWDGSGSGCDLYGSKKPSWQPDVCSGTRATADVSADADPQTPVWVYDTYPLDGTPINWGFVGGTSASAPIVAGIAALASAPSVPMSDAAAIPFSHPSAFNDITSGSAAPCGASICRAAPGYDLPTGLGTPNGVTGFAPALPGPAGNLAAAAESGRVTLSWAPPALDGGSNITGYRVFRSDHGTVPIATLGASARSFTNTGLVNGTTYTYSVAAVNALGTGARSGVSATPAPVAKLVLSPSTASIQAGDSLQYTVAGLSGGGKSLGDETGAAKVSMSKDGSCLQGSCWASTSGTQTVTATLDGVKATATLNVRPGPLGGSSLVVSPRVASMPAGGSRAFTAMAVDDYGNRIGNFTADVVFQISPNGSCTKNVCTAAKPGTHQISATMKSTSVVTSIGGTCSLVASGSVMCWGTNYNGNLADSIGIGSGTLPSTVRGLEKKGTTALSLVSGFGCALVAGGAAECWGVNDGGQLGNASARSTLRPTQVVGLTSGVKSISAGDASESACAVTSVGGVDCWGGLATWQPQPVAGLGGTAASVATSFMGFTCALMTNTGVECWGFDDDGDLGDNNADSPGPVVVTGLSSGVRQLTVGEYHACALTTAGHVECWGSNANGQLGDGTTTDAGVPVAVTGLPGTVRSISTSGNDTCAVTTKGAVYCWGENAKGQQVESDTPKLIPGLASGIQSVTVGGSNSCALTSVGLVRCWGNNYFGQLGVPGVGFFSDKPVTVKIGSVFSTPAKLHVN